MDSFDDHQIEEARDFEFGEALYEGLFDEDEDESYFFSHLNSKYDF